MHFNLGCYLRCKIRVSRQNTEYENKYTQLDWQICLEKSIGEGLSSWKSKISIKVAISNFLKVISRWCGWGSRFHGEKYWKNENIDGRLIFLPDG